MRIRYLFYRPFMRLIHRFGFHYAPKKPMPEPHVPKTGIDGTFIVEHYHWCQWCGLRGTTIETERHPS